PQSHRRPRRWKRVLEGKERECDGDHRQERPHRPGAPHIPEPCRGSPSPGPDQVVVMNDVLDVLVIGGGQAGLAMGHHLARGVSRFLILDAGAQIGQAARQVVVAAVAKTIPTVPQRPLGRDIWWWANTVRLSWVGNDAAHLAARIASMAA